MTDEERFREQRTEPPTAEELDERAAAGWKLTAVEWSRSVEAEAEAARREIPYGLEASPDGRFLIANEGEMAMLRSFLRAMIEDRPLSAIARRLNEDGYRTRKGGEWTQTQLFDLLPRVVEAGAEILRSREWSRESKSVPADG